MLSTLTTEKSYNMAVIIATYKRRDGSTSYHLKNAAEMLKAQTYQDFFIIITGDDYTDPEEFEALVKLFPQEKTISENHPFAYRDVLKNSVNRWTCGGIQANYVGVKKALDMGIDYYVHLDDDDTWLPHHLQTLHDAIQSFPDSDVLYTRSRYGGTTLPRENVTEMHYNNLPPFRENVVHSSTCINLKTLKEPLLKVYECRLSQLEAIRHGKVPEGQFSPFDIEKWDMINQKVREGVCKALFIPKATCIKLTDGNHP